MMRSLFLLCFCTIATAQGPPHWEQNLEAFVEEYRSPTQLSVQAYLDLKKIIWEDPFGENYVNGLTSIHRLWEKTTDQHVKEACEYLALKFQNHWMRKYGSSALLSADRFYSQSVRSATLIGLLISGAALLVNPKGAPAYFRYFRATAFLAPLVGHEIGRRIGRSFQIQLPIPPARIILLGSPASEPQTEEQWLDDLVRTLPVLVGVITQITASHAVTKAIAALSKIVRVAKNSKSLKAARVAVSFAVPALLGLIAMEIAAHYAGKYLDAKERELRLRPLFQHLAIIQGSRRESKLLTSILQLQNEMLALTNWMNQKALTEILQLSEDFQTKLDESSLKLARARPAFQTKERKLREMQLAPEQFSKRLLFHARVEGQRHPRYQENLRTLQDHLADRLHSILSRIDRYSHIEVDDYLTRSHLIAFGEAGLTALTATGHHTGQRLKQAYQTCWQPWAKVNLTVNCPSDFRTFVARVQAQKEKILAGQLKRRVLAPDANTFTLQVSSFIRQTPHLSGRLRDEAEGLLSLIIQSKWVEKRVTQMISGATK